MQDRIEKTVELNAPLSRVWRAVTDHREFGQWFRVDLEGPFVVGELSLGQMTYPGYEHMRWEATVEAMEPERRFAFRWCPYSDNPDADYSKEPTTLVEFLLEPISNGTRLTVIESGFAALPDDPRRIDALRMNEEGWEIQMKHIRDHVDG